MADGATPRVVIITGGSSGLGRATARLFAERGWSVGLIARGAAGLEAVRNELQAGGTMAAFAVADVSDAGALRAAADMLQAELGPVDAWINDAGAGFYAPFCETTEEEFRQVTDITYYGTVHGTRVALDAMLPRNHGVIVNVGAPTAYRAAPLQSAYSAAKFAVRGFTDAVRSELLHDRSRVRLAIVHPPSVNTPFYSHAGARMPGAPRPIGPVFPPEVAAEAIFRAATLPVRAIRLARPWNAGALAYHFAPGLIERARSWVGYGSQQTRDPQALKQRDAALFEAAAGVSGVHGPFTDEAYRQAKRSSTAGSRWMTALGIGMAASLAIVALRRPK